MWRQRGYKKGFLGDWETFTAILADRKSCEAPRVLEFSLYKLSPSF